MISFDGLFVLIAVAALVSNSFSLAKDKRASVHLFRTSTYGAATPPVPFVASFEHVVQSSDNVPDVCVQAKPKSPYSDHDGAAACSRTAKNIVGRLPKTSSSAASSFLRSTSRGSPRVPARWKRQPLHEPFEWRAQARPRSFPADMRTNERVVL